MVDLQTAEMLFCRLGVSLWQLDEVGFRREYYRLAKRYHPDCGTAPSHELMANINQARSVVRSSGILKHHQRSA